MNDDIDRIPQVKHLAFYQEQNKDYEFQNKVSLFIERAKTVETLHTFFLDHEIGKTFPFQQFKCMRVLKLTSHKSEKLDDSIGDLVHLRYLHLSYPGITVLPESIGKLYHLQTLKLQHCHLKTFPKSMRNLISLRNFMSTKSLPANIVGQMISLRNLPSFTVVRRKGHGIEELHHLNNLSGKLCIFDLENVRSKEDAIKADLSRKKYLYDIQFSWSRYYEDGDDTNVMDILEGLQPPRDVKILTINNFSGDNFPAWVMKMDIDIKGKSTPLDKLMSITLSGCRSCLSLPTLEHLPHLRDLVLENMDNLTCLGSSNVNGSTKPLSPSLRSLKLFGMKRLEKWIDGATNSSKMISPVLDSLVIIDCPKIILLDECHPHPLVSLRICYCIGLISIKSIQGLTSLVSLEIVMCPSLLEITDLPNRCQSLKTLQIKHCDKLTSLPHQMFDCFAFLNELELGAFSEELASFPSLQGIEKLRDNLHSLDLRGRYHWDSVPEEIQHLTSLTELTIRGFGMRALPMWLTTMLSIRHLTFHECKGLNKETVVRGAPPEATYVELYN